MSSSSSSSRSSSCSSISKTSVTSAIFFEAAGSAIKSQKRISESLNRLLWMHSLLLCSALPSFYYTFYEWIFLLRCRNKKWKITNERKKNNNKFMEGKNGREIWFVVILLLFSQKISSILKFFFSNIFLFHALQCVPPSTSLHLFAS